jgi:serine/threonine-protein kinase
MEKAGSFIEDPALESLSPSAVLAISQMPDFDQRVLEPGNSLGPYTILEFVGAGGMGEVYRARDAKLNRDVALKVRRAAFTLDSDRLARFKREAQMLAALNHPNVAAIYGLEDSDAGQALVLELVEGATLAGRIAKGRIPINEALSIGKQIAQGLEAAHERGIIHSDLKPANIKLRPDGTVKILDFGLAKALGSVEAASLAPDADIPTSSQISRDGMIFGTAAYMSPEQARGEALNKRIDIWAFGCVLYEALTGRRAFRGDAADEARTAVLNQDPDWNALPVETPASVVRLLHKCLEKDPGRRLHDIADARIEIEDASVPAPVAVHKRHRPALWALAGIAAIAFSIAVWSWRPVARPTEAAPSVKRLQVRLPEAEPLARAWSMPLGLGQPSIAVSPDGARLAYVLERQGVTQLYLRPLDDLEATPIVRTEGAFGPFFSPDGRWIGFFAEHKLKKVAVSGGEPIQLCNAPNAYGGSWATDGTILFATDEGRRLMRVRESGGACQPVQVRDDRGSWRLPDILPGGKEAIVTNALLGIGVLSLETGEFRVLDGKWLRRPVCAEWASGFCAAGKVAGGAVRSNAVSDCRTGSRDSRGRADGRRRRGAAGSVFA